jgi:small conductance mechanosensitive channel
LAVGLALQGTLSNLAAGVMLLIFRPFRIGHKLQVGANIGTVETIVAVLDGVGNRRSNTGHHSKCQRMGPTLAQLQRLPSAPPPCRRGARSIGENTDLQPTLDKVRGIVEAQPRVLADPAPKILVDRSAAENALEIVVAFSTPKDETADAKSDLIKAIHDALPVAA